MIKKIANFCATAMICGAETACSFSKNESVLPVKTSLDKLSLKAVDISMSEDFKNITNLSRDPTSGKIFVFGIREDESYSGYLTDHTFSDYDELRFIPQEGEKVKCAVLLKMGKKAILTVHDCTTYIYIYDSSNALEKTINCGELLVDDSYATLIAGENSVIIDQSIHGDRELTAISTSDDKVLGKVKLDEAMYIGASLDKDGVLTIVYGSHEKTYTAHIDGIELVDKTECSMLDSSAYSMCAGLDDYMLIANLGKSLFGLKDGKWNEITTNIEGGIEFYSIHSFAMTAENEFAAIQYGDFQSKLMLLTSQDISRLKSKQVVTLACFTQNYSLGQYDEVIKKFNTENENYRIEYKNYWNEDKRERDYDQLRLDIVSGNGPDIIPFDPEFTVDSFNSEVFFDLYNFIDKEPDLKREDFIPNVRKALERDGKMIMITPTFFNYQTVTAKSGYPGVRENWSFDDMIEAYNALPEGMYFFSSNEDVNPREMYFTESVMNYYFIDYDKAECSFDSPEFIKMLNFFNDNKIGLTWDEYNNLSGSFLYSDDHKLDVLKGKTFIEFERGNCFWFGTLYEKVRYYYDNECVLVGYPYNGKRNGSFINLATCLGIVANSPNKEGAWSFLRYMLSDQYYNDPNNFYCFPVIESIFDERAQMSVDGLLAFPQDENGHYLKGDMIRQDWEILVNEWNGRKFENKGKVKLKPFTQEECDYYKNLIKNSEVIRYDNTIEQIIYEETLPFFNFECSAESCAKKIQNRASLYLSERYGR